MSNLNLYYDYHSIGIFETIQQCKLYLIEMLDITELSEKNLNSTKYKYKMYNECNSLPLEIKLPMTGCHAVRINPFIFE